MTGRTFWVISVCLFGCEDGPTQIYGPSPAGAAGAWNDGKPVPWVDNAYAEFTGPFGPPVPKMVCKPVEKAAHWAALLQQPIVPPRQGSGIDLAGGDSWKGITVEEAEQVNCDSDARGDVFGDGNLTNSWGDNQEVLFEYDPITQKIFRLTFSPGYLGAMTFQSRDGLHSYQIAIGQPVTKDGNPFALDWSGVDFPAQAGELYQALLATYAPALPAGGSCLDVGHCVKGAVGESAYLDIPVLGLTLTVDHPDAPQPIPSIPSRIDQRLAKTLPLSAASVLLKLDKDGPTGDAGMLGASQQRCLLQLGASFGDFLGSCVQVSGDAGKDQVALNELLAGLSHDTERFKFTLTGVSLDFSDGALPANAVVGDGDAPHPADPATRFFVDQLTFGPIANDRDANGAVDLHGTGAVYREYARLVRSRLLALAGNADGDVSLCRFPSPIPPKFDPVAFLAALPPHCTGFEGFITPAPPDVKGDPLNLGPGGAIALDAGLSLGLKPGRPQAVFCMDATGDLATGYHSCVTGDLFATSLTRVQQIFGRGKLANLPPEARDLRFFFQAYVRALVEYLPVGAQDPAPVLAGVIDPDGLLVTATDAGGYDVAQYIDRSFAAKQPPFTFSVRADLANGVIENYEFSRELMRGETAVYTLMNTQGGIAQFDDGALLTNVFGSPVLKQGWTNSTAGKTAWYCATANPPDPAHCDGQTPPLDGNGNVLCDDLGRPILVPYARAMASAAATRFDLGTTRVAVTATFPPIQSAMVDIPSEDIHLPDVQALLPWLPKQAGVGFPVAVDGAPDHFVSASRIDFSGDNLAARVYEDIALDPMSHQPLPGGAVQLLAVETDRFLGDVFLCQDARTRDLLRARMYAPSSDLLGWLSAHPGAAEACGIVISYDAFGNFLDHLTSLKNGVRLEFTPDAVGRVVDVTLFLPGQ